MCLRAASAEDLNVYFNIPPLGPATGPFYVAKSKPPENAQSAALGVNGSNNDVGTYAWQASGFSDSASLRDPQDMEHSPSGPTAAFYCTAASTGTVTVTQSGVPGHDEESATCTSRQIFVFDAELHSHAQGITETNEDTVPTFIGPGCVKEIDISVDPGTGSLPTPPSLSDTGEDPHWSMTLSMAQGAPGVWFYHADTDARYQDPETEEPWTELRWGWQFVEPHYDEETQQQVPGHWEEERCGVTPPQSVKIGPAGPPFSNPRFLTLALSVSDGQSGATASDQVMVVSVAINEHVEHDPDGSGPRNLWFFNVPGDSPTPALYSQVMTLSASDIEEVGGLTYAWSKTGDAVQTEDIVGHPEQKLLRAQAASVQVNDVEVTLKILGQDAAKHKLTVYAPTKLRWWNPDHNPLPVNRYDYNWAALPGWAGYDVHYHMTVVDQFGELPIPKMVDWSETFGAYSDPNHPWAIVPREEHGPGTSDDSGHVEDDYKISSSGPGGDLQPWAVFPADHLNGANAFEVAQWQFYCVGSQQAGVGVHCNYDGTGAGQQIYWCRGHARQHPEPPGTMVPYVQPLP